MQFDIVQIFTITGNNLVRCNYFFKNNNALVVEYPRSETLHLTFNPVSNEITYNEFNQAGETGRPERTGKTIVLKLYHSKFVTIN